MRADAGQASVEYLGVVGVVAVVAVALVAPALAGRDLASAVVRQVHRALCVVRGGDCEQDRRPCVVASRGIEDSGYVDLAIVHIGSRELVLRQERSDGTVAVTFVRDRSGGLQLGTGAGVHARLGGLQLHAGTELTAAVLASAGSGTTWVVRDARAADRLVAQLSVDGIGDLVDRIAHAGPDTDGFPRPSAVFGREGLAVTLGGAAGRGTSARLALGSEELEGQSTDLRTGRRTYLVRRRNDVVAALATRGRDRGSAGAGADEAYTVTVDRSGRPIDLGILRGSELRGAVSLPGPVRRIAGELAGGTVRARRWETEQHLDLTEPDNLAAAQAFLGQVASASPRLGAVASVGDALRRRLDQAGVLDARVYSIEGDSTGVEAGAQVRGISLGSGYVRRHERGRLQSAMQRGPDGLWRRRTDCTAAEA